MVHLLRRFGLWGIFILAVFSANAFGGATYIRTMYPLVFEKYGTTTDEDTTNQITEWNLLVKYKLFATGEEDAAGITLMGDVAITDSVGYTGSAKGNLVFGNQRHNLGGPVLMGGSFSGGDGNDTISTGPVRFLKYFEPSFNSRNSNVFRGDYCFDNGYNEEYTSPGLVAGGGTVLTTEQCETEDYVPFVEEDLDVPVLDAAYNAVYHSALNIDNTTGYIHVPPLSEADSASFNYFVQSITLGNNGKLIVVMPPNGRNTKVILSGSISGLGGTDNNNITVAEAASLDQWNATDSTWDVSNITEMENSDYAGNLLFYTPNDLSLGAGQKLMQGTYISGGTINFAQNTTFAGQLLAKTIYIDANFDAKDFRYVPFDPPILDPIAGASGIFPESDENVKIPIKLSEAAQTDVVFNYCFDLKDESETASGSASIQDFNITEANMPICDNDEYGSVTIKKGDLEPTGSNIVYVNVYFDDLLEENETFRLKIFGMSGAVLANNDREGYITLTVQNVNKVKPPRTSDVVVTVAEDDTLTFVFDENDTSKSSFYYVDESIEPPGAKSVIIKTVPDNGTLIYKGEVVTIEGSNYVYIPVDSVQDLKFIPAENEYGDVYATFTYTVESKDSVALNDGIMTIQVTPVNDVPVAEDAVYTVQENQVAAKMEGSITVTDVDDTSFTYTFLNTQTLFTINTTTGEISLSSGVSMDYETMDTVYTVKVVVSDKSQSTGGNTGDILRDTIEVTIKVIDVNDNPVITTDSIRVVENAQGGTVVDTVKATDEDFIDTVLTYSLAEPSDYFEISEDGVVTVKEGAVIDYEKTKYIVISVKVTDSQGGSAVKNITVYVTDIPSSTISITTAENRDSSWKNPDTLYTNVTDLKLYCSYNGFAEEICADTTLVEGINIIVKTFDDPSLDGAASDTVVIYLSTATPLVSISTDPDAEKSTNIYTIVESTDDSDSSIYVNSTSNTIYITVTDPVTQKDSSFTVSLELDTISVSDKVYSNLESVIKQGVALDENPSTTVIYTPVNGEKVEVSYTTTVAGSEVTVSYYTDNDGEILKEAVVNDKGEVDSIEVITVTYTTTINGKEVTVSYVADAVTGTPLVTDSSGNLMTETYAEKNNVSASTYQVSYDYVDANGNTVTVTYGVDESGNLVKNSSGDVAYTVSYTYTNSYGNSATESVTIILDMVCPKVEILYPANGQVIRANYTDVVWTIDGVEQDTLTTQGLEKGMNKIMRYYRDKAGNESYDSIYVIMKDSKDVVVTVETPVTIITKDLVEEYYSTNPPEEGETFAVTIKNPTTGEEIETLVGGDFETKEGSLEDPYPGVSGNTHLGPTLELEIKMPVVNGVGGLATLDDLLSSDGMVPLEGVDAANSEKVTVEEYIAEYCDEDVSASGDLSQINLYNSRMKIKIWIFTTLGNYVNYFSFTQEMNNPDYVSEAGMLEMYFEMKPDTDGYVRAENGSRIATGAYLYKVEANLRSTLRCTLPPVNDESGKKRGDVVRSTDELLTPFGYKRPNN